MAEAVHRYKILVHQGLHTRRLIDPCHRLQDPVGVINNPSSQSSTTSDPHTSIQVLISLVASLKVDIQPKPVLLRLHTVGRDRIKQLLKRVQPSGSDGPPTLGVHGDVRAVVRLEQVVRVDVSAEVRSDYLVVLSSRDDDSGAPGGGEVPSFEPNPIAVASSRCSRPD